MQFLTERRGALLADEMGLGKTIQAVVALSNVLSADGGRALVVVPASLRLNWGREFARWAPNLVVRRLTGKQRDRVAYYRLPIQVLIASYEQIREDFQALLANFVVFEVVVIDEAQRIKNPNSAVNLACKLLPRNRSWALTGTPLENRPEDLRSILGFVEREAGFVGLELSELHKAMEPLFLRRRKSEVAAELPPIISQDLLLELPSIQRSAYDEVWEARLDSQSTAGMLGMITNLKQLCNFDPESGESVKLEALRAISSGTDRLLIVSQYVETLRWLSERLSIPSNIYDGSQTFDQREAALQAFRTREGPRALLLSLRAGGVGLNIPEASAVVLFDRWWNPQAEEQAIHRAHRLGRLEPLLVYRFLVVDSIEERIQELLEEKLALFETFVEDAPQSAPPAGILRRILQVPFDPAQAEGERPWPQSNK